MSAGQRSVLNNFTNASSHTQLHSLLVGFGHVMLHFPRCEYRWFNGTSTIKLSAPDYVRALFSWVEQLLKCKSLFPTEPGQIVLKEREVPVLLFTKSLLLNAGALFRPDFMAHARVVFKRLFRVYAHLYYSHVDDMCQLKALTHMNTRYAM